MTLPEALDILVAHTGHERYRWLCSDDNPDQAQRDAYRRLVIEQANPDFASQLAADREAGIFAVETTPRSSCCGG